MDYAELKCIFLMLRKLTDRRRSFTDRVLGIFCARALHTRPKQYMNRPHMKTKEAMLLMFKNVLSNLNATDSLAVSVPSSEFCTFILFLKAIPCHL
jgi:hypothetical protein